MIVETKWCGKTSTVRRASKSVLYLQYPNQYFYAIVFASPLLGIDVLGIDDTAHISNRTYSTLISSGRRYMSGRSDEK